MSMIEYSLPNPGLVENSRDAEHCVQACLQMVFRTQPGIHVPSFGEMDRLLNTRPGRYTWEFRALRELSTLGFSIKLVQEFDLAAFAEDPAKYLLMHYGNEIGQHHIDKSDLEQVAIDAQALLTVPAIAIEVRRPELDDIEKQIKDDNYLLCTVNQRTLQADPGYVAHVVFIYGVSPRGVRLHNPGPPATAATEVAWALFDRAWSSPNPRARNFIAISPYN